MTPTWPITLRVILMSILIGGASGVLTTALTTNYLSDYALELSELTEPLRLTEQRPTAFPSSYEDAVEQLKTNGLPALSQLSTLTSSTISMFDQTLVPASVLTSDGWMLTSQSGYFAQALVADNVCEVTERLTDQVTGVVFVKCDARSLSVVGFGAGYEVKAGQQVFVASSSWSFSPADIVQIRWPAATSLSADEPHRRLILSMGYEPEIGAAVFDLSSKLVGIVESVDTNGEVVVLPIESVMGAFESLLHSAQIERPYLGVNVLDLSKTVVSADLGRDRKAGALVYGSPSVVYASPAQKAGLQKGDIILSVNRQTIDNNHSLDEYVMQHHPGEELLLLVDRDGVEIDVSVTLGTQ